MKPLSYEAALVGPSTAPPIEVPHDSSFALGVKSSHAPTGPLAP